MINLLDDLPILPEIKAALLEGKGHLGIYLRLAKAYEFGDWELQKELTQQIFGKEMDLSNEYLLCIDWAHGLMKEAG